LETRDRQVQRKRLSGWMQAGSRVVIRNQAVNPRVWMRVVAVEIFRIFSL
jgi:hypothetical protein